MTSIAGGDGWRAVATLQRPDIANWPIPAFSLAAFLAAVYWTIQQRQPTPVRMLLLTAAWSLQAYMHVGAPKASQMFHPGLQTARAANAG